VAWCDAAIKYQSLVAYRELHVAWCDAGLLVVAGGVAGELEDLSREVLQHGREVNRGTRADTRRVLALLTRKDNQSRV
jgi:hypothetical protein